MRLRAASASSCWQRGFAFLAIIICVIVLFRVVNTMTMCLMERVAEIGTMRTLGAQCVSVGMQFFTQGALLGLAGATLKYGRRARQASLENRNVMPSPMARIAPLGRAKLPAMAWAGDYQLW